MSSSPTKQRTISYQRASWTGSPGMTLQQALGDCLTSMPAASDTRLPLRDGHAEARHREVKKQSVRLHVAAWTDGENASIVPHTAGRTNVDLRQQAPSPGTDYLDGDGMVFVSGDHCLLMPSGLHPKSIERYLQLLLQAGRDVRGARLPAGIESFDLLKVADPEIVQTIRHQGVKRFHLDVGQYRETVRAAEDAQKQSIIRQQLGRNTWEPLLALLKREEDRKKIMEAENIQVKLTITCDTRKGGIEPDDLTPIATGLADESQDDVEVETVTGTRIKRGQLILTRSVQVAEFGKTVHHNDAWDQMEQYFEQLREGGMLEE